MDKFKQKLINAEVVFKNHIQIPEYQRRYSWKHELADGLVSDLIAKFLTYPKNNSDVATFKDEWSSQNNNDMFYLGQIVKNDSNVVDGQQRLTTIHLIFKAINDELKRRGFKNELFSWLFTGFQNMKISPAKIDEKISKVFQNGSETFQEYEKRMKGATDDKSKLNNNNELKLVKKSKFFKSYNVITKSLKAQKFTEQQLKNLVHFILRDVHFLAVEIDDISDAIKFFEIMNSKSVPLTAADLIKNGLIKASTNKEAAAKSWNDVTEELVEYTNDLSKFIRYIYIANNGPVSQAKLFKAIKSNGHSTVVEDMKKYLPSYKIMIGAAVADSIENDAMLNFVLKLGARESLSPILLEILNIKNLEKSSSLLRELVSFSFKYFYISGFKSNAYSQSVTKVCKNIREGNEKPLKALWIAYRDNIQNDSDTGDINKYKEEWFELGKDDSRKSMKFARAIYPLLFSKLHTPANYDKQEYNQSNSINISNLDVEHLYPQNPNFENSSWDAEMEEDLKWNIGNLIPIASSKNRIAKNSSFSDKFKFYNGVTGNSEASVFFVELFLNLNPKNKKTSSMEWDGDAIIARNKEVFNKIDEIDLLSLKIKFD